MYPKKLVHCPGRNAAYEPFTHGSSTHESSHERPLNESRIPGRYVSRNVSASSTTPAGAIAWGTSVGYPAPVFPPV